VINIAIELDLSDAVKSDSLGDTVDYKRIKRRIVALVEKSRYALLERMTYEILREVLSHDRVAAATVRVDKPHALRFARSVSVEMHAERPS
jgi:D-erythro-7,8-dihydroneopterin triphosphate epimerase